MIEYKVPISGVYVALLTPINVESNINVSGNRRNIEFLLEKGIRNFAINGATGEYSLSSTEELSHIL